MKKRRAHNRSRTARASKKDAWAAAAAYGVDMNLLEINLRLTPRERIRAHRNALALVEALEAAGKRLYGKRLFEAKRSCAEKAVGRVPSRGGLATLADNGYAIVENAVPSKTVSSLIKSLERDLPNTDSLERSRSHYGGRNLLRDLPIVRTLAKSQTIRSLVEPLLGKKAFAVRSLFFDKTASANWPVSWHQDRTIAVREKRDIKGFGPWTIKAGVPHAQPPVEVLENMLTVRLHLDHCDETNGPLRVIAGSHREGYLDAEAIRKWTTNERAINCLVEAGGIVLMRPLLLHSSVRATRPHHRRVIHLEFASEPLPEGLEWFESLRHERS